MATKLKIINDVADIVPALQIPDSPNATTAPAAIDFDIAPTRKRHAGWTADGKVTRDEGGCEGDSRARA